MQGHAMSHFGLQIAQMISLEVKLLTQIIDH